ncbi:Lecithin-cholesterol_acyltransferase [Hexamita inflata]|uniref:Lecithin-cholesterol acyltransferase n=1 Tax=Hexamita inflata TaxID=28002 RepID=A0AA86NC01_9EUKA|nr:Lecithin-cholesterol acyltransferase [Hexamita inflata]CAI9972876.1 Lecithin-cholesterol acyltransferase [Hexamita inflata]
MNPVILVPGLFGSRLEAVSRKNPSDKKLVWFPSLKTMNEDMVYYLWGKYISAREEFVSFCDDEYAIQPVLGVDGCLTLTDLYKVPIVGKKACYFYDMHKMLVKSGRQVTAFTYDWRQDPTGSFIQSKFREFIIQQRQVFKTTKFDLVCHSMGGQVINQFMAQNPDADQFINKLIILGTPFNGANGRALNYFNIENLRDLKTSDFVFRGFAGASNYAFTPHKRVDIAIQTGKRNYGVKKCLKGVKETTKTHQLIIKQLPEDSLLIEIFKHAKTLEDAFEMIKQLFKQREEKIYTFENLDEYFELINDSVLAPLFSFDSDLNRQIQSRLAQKVDIGSIKALVLSGTGKKMLNFKLEEGIGDKTVLLESAQAYTFDAQYDQIEATHMEMVGEKVFKKLLDFIK